MKPWRFSGPLLAFTALFVAGCIPADDRPTPGKLTVSVSGTQAAREGIRTHDGWLLQFSRVLVGVGRAALSDPCVEYSSANYDRVFELTGRGPQHLSVLYGLGSCDVRFRIGPPSSDAILTEGVVEADKSAMRVPGSDPYVPQAGIALYVEGSGTRDAITKRFSFSFRPRLRLSACVPQPFVDGSAPEAGAPLPPRVVLRGGETSALEITLDVSALFRDHADPRVETLYFDPFAAADIDGDGTITLSELTYVSLESLRDGGAADSARYQAPSDASTGALDAGEEDDADIMPEAGPRALRSLSDFVYLVLFPTMSRMGEGGQCSAQVLFSSGR